MFKIFKRNKFNSTLYDIELKLEQQQKQIDDLRKMVLEISSQINSLTIEVNHLVNNRYGKSI
jgi:peptidoglycan hydrolase CwlO-like protein